MATAAFIEDWRIYASKLKVKLNKDDKCWPWLGSPSGGSLSRAYRAIYERKNGKIPDGLDLDHLCMNRICCNPFHLEAVSRSENIRRSYAARGPKKFCKRGHELTLENTIPRNGGYRRCRLCSRIHVRKSYWRKRK